MFDIHELDPILFLTAPWLATQTAFKKTKVKLKLVTDTDILSMLEKDIRGGVYHVIQQYAKANNKYIKIIMKISNHCILSSGM